MEVQCLKWEYKVYPFSGETLHEPPKSGVLPFGENQEFEKIMNLLGNDGWELVTVMLHYELTMWYAFFKREKK